MLPGERLDEFEIRQLLGKGGMGEVYEAFQPSLQRFVALKTLPEWLSGDADSLRRFQEEAGVAARLDHPNIVPIFSFGCSGNQYYYTMKLVRGLSLTELIRSHPAATKRVEILPETIHRQVAPDFPTENLSSAGRGQEPTDQQSLFSLSEKTSPSLELDRLLKSYRSNPFLFTARVGERAARAIAFAHDQGRLHRDIKPSNIMLDSHDQVYLIDFGLTQAIEKTFSGAMCGTLKYMSPEQLNLEKLDARSDIYSLGATLYELVATVPPFKEKDTPRLARSIREGSTERLEQAVPTVPPRLAACIHKAMNVDWEKRFQTAESFADELNAIASELPETSPVVLPKPVVTRKRWLWSDAVLLLAVLLIAGGFGFGLFDQSDGKGSNSTGASNTSENTPRRRTGDVDSATRSTVKAGSTRPGKTNPAKSGKVVVVVEKKAAAGKKLGVGKKLGAGKILGVGRWNELFIREPINIHDDRGVSTRLLVGQRLLHVKANRGSAILPFGETKAPAYIISLTLPRVQSQRDNGTAYRTGIFFGAHRDELPNGNECLRFQTITFQYIQNKNTLAVVRELVTLGREENGEIGVLQAETIAFDQLSVADFDGAELEVSVGPEGLRSVFVNRVSCGKELTRSKHNERVSSRYYRGRFGVIVSAGEAEMKNARVKILNSKR